MATARPSAPKPDAQLEHQRLLSLVNSMTDGVIAVDDQVKVVIYNAAALNVLDLNSSMQGKSLGKFLQPFTAEGEPVDVIELVRQTALPATNRDLRLHYSDGSVINLYLNIAPVHLGFGKDGNGGFVLILRDITREKSLEEERDEFISVVSHELRTPIAIAEGNISNAQMITERAATEAPIGEALKQAHDQVMFLADMINDLATLSRAEHGDLSFEAEAINVHQLMEDLSNTYRGSADAKNLTIRTELDPHLELLYSSKLYVREVLQNFVTNAIKYTDSGTVTLRAKPADDGVNFEVSDEGIGISKSDQERVFDKFFRSEDYHTRQHSGTGLGLYITMKLARLLKAEVGLKSELSKGSTFTIFVPNTHNEPGAPTS
jgi:PAS domain S-box-containing protein